MNFPQILKSVFIFACIEMNSSLKLFHSSNTMNTRKERRLVNSVTTIMHNNIKQIDSDLMANNTSKQIQNNKEVEALTIKFYSSVTTESAMALTDSLGKLDVQSRELEIKYNCRIPIKLHIQSLGGELMPTFYVCDFIQSIETPVHIYIDGFVASAASVIAVCGNKRFMTNHSTILVHQLSSSTSGKFNEMKEEMSNLKLFMDNLKDIYLTNTNIKDSELEKLLSSELWLSSNKCLELGLVDKIV